MRPEDVSEVEQTNRLNVPISPTDVSEILRISQRIEQFINDNGWSWCVMDRVCRVLKSAHQG